MSYQMYFDTAKGVTMSRPQWFDNDGNPVADAVLRDAGVFPVLPVPASHDPLLQSAVWDDPQDWPLVGGVYQRTQTVTDKDLLAVQAEALRQIDRLAESARGAVLTHGAGQALEYARTEQEARAWSAGADPADYPMLSAELAAQQVADPSATMAEVVADTLAAADLWVTIGAAIKQVRRTAKVAVEHAQLGADCRLVLDWATAQLAAIPVSGTFVAFS